MNDPADNTAAQFQNPEQRSLKDRQKAPAIQKILDHIEAQPPPLSPATAIQS
jgi:hypothetical protein